MLLPLERTDALEAHRNDLGSRLLRGRDMPLHARVRLDPFPTLHVDWQRAFPFDITVNATSEEGIVSPELHGALLIQEITMRCGTAATNSCRVALGLAPRSPAPQATLDLEQSGLPRLITDSTSGFIGVYFATTLLATYPIGRVIRGPLSRLSIVVNNTSAGAQNVTGFVKIVQLSEEAGAYPIAP